MIARVPLFAGLDKDVLAELAKRLQAVVALPDEKIIVEGSTPDAMYFIAAGEVTVMARTGPVVLREGDFFGEMGLLDKRPRSADVIADGYTHLLMLHRRDFDRLLERRPEVRAEIQQVAARRTASNAASE
jgi:CPA1 family monovalent cation:H+ antiporter